ncbi:MAG: glycosyl transferase, partial [Streptomyces sp.]
GSGGLAGMAMSALSAPIYAKSLGAAVVRRPSRFVVTPKGGDASPDRVLTFRIHLFWAAVLASSLVASFVLDHTHVAMRTWAVLAMAISLAPVAIWSCTLLKGRRVRGAARQKARRLGREDADSMAATGAEGEPEPAFATGTTTGGN